MLPINKESKGLERATGLDMITAYGKEIFVTVCQT